MLVVFGNLSGHRERADGVAADTEAADLHGRGACQADEPFLRRRVGRVRRVAETGGRAGVDDHPTTLARHVRDRRADQA